MTGPKAKASTRYTKHGLSRVSERLSISPAYAASILDADLAVTLGVQPFSNKLARLFFSLLDDRFYVAIQDFATGHVITVLTLSYYENLHGRVIVGDLKKAEKLVVTQLRAYRPTAEQSIQQPSQTKPRQQKTLVKKAAKRAKSVKVLGVIGTELGGWQVVDLGEWPTPGYAKVVDVANSRPLLAGIRHLVTKSKVDKRSLLAIRLKHPRAKDELEIAPDAVFRA